jgi:NADP-dependent 3-hydroxy acid dehydrogenase YdfG
MTEAKPLTANSTIADWLAHPTGGPLVRGLLTQTGASEEMLTPIKGLPLQQLVALSQGQLPQSVLDELVLQANDGIAPVEDQETGWVEQITSGRFTGQTVIITGAASGIGRATASRVAREGGTVIAVDISAERLESLKTALPQSHIVAVTGDITRQDDIDGIVAAAGNKIDALANIAGINDDFSPLHETSDAMWDRVIGINLTGAFKLSRAVLPAMLSARKGSIVNVASEAALRGDASGNAYTVSKHGVHRAHPLRRVHVRARWHPRQRGRTWRRRDRHPDATQHVADRVRTASPVTATDPHCRHCRATSGIDHVPVVRRRHQHQRRHPPL